jgi:hypothetical protein
LTRYCPGLLSQWPSWASAASLHAGSSSDLFVHAHGFRVQVT